MRSIASIVYGGLWNGRIRFISWFKGIRLGRIGRDCTIYPTAVLYGGRKISLGDRVTINDFVHVWAGGGVTIGDDSMIASHCAIVSQTHDVTALSRGLKYRETLLSDKPVVIGRNVWIGAAAVILPGVTIGDNAVVGAGAVVTSDVAPGMLVMGVPARQIRQLEGA